MDGSKQFVTIIARELNILNGQLIFITEEPSERLKIHLYIQEFSGGAPSCVIMSSALAKTGGTSFLLRANLNEPDRLAYNKTITFNRNQGDDAEFITKTRTVPSIWNIGSTFYWLMVQTFQEAYLKMANEVDTAISMFRWIGINAQLDWSGDTVNEMRSLGAQAAAMTNYLGRPARINYVPLLNLSTQIETIRNYLTDAQRIEAKYHQFITITQSYETRKSIANQFNGEVEAQIQNTRNLITNARTQLQTVQEQYQINQKHFQHQSSGLDEDKNELPGPMAIARNRLKEALERKREQAIKDAVFAVIGAVASLAEAAGGGAAAGPAAVGQLARVVEQINKVIELVEKINKVVETIESIMDLVEAIENDRDLPDADFQIPNIEDSQQLQKSDWQALRERWDSGFNPYISDDILGPAMSDYRAEGRILFIYGEALTESRQSIAALKNKISQLTMQIQVYNAQKRKIDEFVNLQQEDENLYKQVTFLLRQQYFRFKRCLLLQLQDYKDAFRYWALQAPRTTGYDLSRDMASVSISSITQELNSAQQNLNRQSAVICHISRDISEDAKDKSIGTVGQFQTWREHQFASDYSPVFRIPLQLSDDAFRGWDRIRIQGIEVLFEGLENIQSNLNKSYQVKIVNTGSYADRLTNNGTSVYWNFTSQENLSLRYSTFVRNLTQTEKLPNDSVVNMRPTAASSFLTLETAKESNPLGGFYDPTVFTTWVITVVHAGDNRTIDWSGVTSIKLRLYATAMGSR